MGEEVRDYKLVIDYIGMGDEVGEEDLRVGKI